MPESKIENPKSKMAEPFGPLPGAMSPALAALGILHLDQYFGLWCVIPERFMAQAERVQGMDLLEHVAARRAAIAASPASPASPARQAGPAAEPKSSRGDGREYEMLPGNVAVIQVAGTLTKYGSSFDDSSSSIAVRRKVRQAANDPDVLGILIRFDSPGGSSAGTQDLADDVAAAATRKPVYAYCEDLCASAAYWVASQCSKVFCNRSAMVGSIGTYAVLQDMSGMATQLGIKVHVVRAGAFKGAGEPGTEITAEQLAEWQRVVDETNDFFLRGVASGRKMGLSKVQELADGRVHIGQAAVSLGLVDAVQTLDETVTQLTTKVKKGKTKMSASYKELKAALPRANAEFITSCLDQEMEIEAAKSAWMEHLEQRSAELTTKLKAAKAKQEEDEDEDDDEDEDEDKTRKARTPKSRAAKSRKAKAKQEEEEDEDEDAKGGKCPASYRPGTDGVGTKQPTGRRQNAYTGDPVNDFGLLVAEVKRDNPHISRIEAIHQAIRRDPELHKQYVRATNPSDPGTQALVDSLLTRHVSRQPA